MKLKHLHAAIVVLSLLAVGTQPALGTKYIPSDTSIGTWDSSNRIYTLTTDVVETVYTAIEIEEDNLTLDGAGYTVTGSGIGSGVYLFERTDVTIHNLNVQGFDFGIHLRESSSNTLTGNTVSNNNHTGIGLYGSDTNTLSGNTALNSTYFGIYLTSSSYNTLSVNTATNNGHGIHLNSYCINNTVTGNTASSNNGHGINLSIYCSNNTVTGNTANSNLTGIMLYSDCSNNAVIDNTANSNSNNGIAILHSSDNNRVTGNTASNNSNTGIGLHGSDTNTLSGNTASNNFHGIYLYNSSNNTVAGNTSNSNAFHGILIQNSSNNTVTGNTSSSNSNSGVVLAPYCNNNSVTGNTASNNQYGIVLGLSSDNQISNNNLSGNETAILSNQQGQGNSYLNNDLSNSTSWSLSLSYESEFELSGNDFTNSANGIALQYIDGVSLSNVDLTTIQGGSGLSLGVVTNSSFSNIIVSGCEYGIFISRTSTGNTFHNNTVSDSTRGIHISYDSSGNTIYNNNFINNTTQAYVDGSSGSIFNLDKPIGGNYWSDWITPDADGDGFVDTPYVFTGGQDDLPWAEQDGWLCKDPQEMITELANQVLSLNLQQGIDNSLDAKLDAVSKALDDVNENNDVAAIGALGAFIDAVEAQSGSKISQSHADALVFRAQRIIDCLGGS
jgi:parallel beta-helix repeat protein